MLLDTGGAMTALEMDFVMELDLPQTYAGVTMTAVTGETSWLATTAPSFAVGTIERSEVPLMILPGYDYRLAPGEPVGILALDFFTDYDLSFDFKNDRFEAFPSADCIAPGGAVEVEDPDLVPLIDRRSDFLTILVQLDGTGLNAIIDTGAAYSVVNGDIAAQRLGIDPLRPDDRMTQVDDVSGVPVYERRFSNLVIGGMEISEPHFTLFPNLVRDTGIMAQGGGQISLPQAIIGMDILHGLQLHVSADGNSIRITEAGDN